jgi:hypothetical protein
MRFKQTLEMFLTGKKLFVHLLRTIIHLFTVFFNIYSPDFLNS